MNHKQYYLYDEEEDVPRGPVELEMLRQMASVGVLKPEHYVVEVGGQQWKQISELGKLKQILFPPPVALDVGPRKIVPIADEDEDELDIRAMLALGEIERVEDPLIPALRDPEAYGLNRGSRRRRDYLVLLIGCNASVGVILLVVGINPLSLVLGFSFMVLFSVGITWVMFGVMGRY